MQKSLLTLYQLIKDDYKMISGGIPTLRAIVFGFFVWEGFRATCLYRLGHYCYRHGWRVIAAIIHQLIFHLCQCTISLAAEIDGGFCIRHCGSVVVGGAVKIGKNCDIRQGVTFGGNTGKTKNGRT